MEAVFLEILNMSITANWLIVVVILLRLILKKAPKNLFCILWALVALRLICPFSIESVFSLIPSSQTISPEIVYEQTPEIHSGLPTIDSVINQGLETTVTPQVTDSVNPLQVWTFIGAVIWVTVILVFLLYAVISYIKLYKKVREGMLLKENIWLCDYIDTPFILGIIKPRIFLPSQLKQEQMEYVLSHEKTHIRRRDYWWKPLGFFVLAVYWINPLVWVAYVLFCKDMELSCDEKVVRDYDLQNKKDYSKALLECSISSHMISACPLAFGETGVKERIKFILNYKKPAFWMILIGIIAAIAVALCFMTNPKQITENQTDIDMAEEQEKHSPKQPEETNKNQPATHYEKYQVTIEEAVLSWAGAFAGRDGETIAALSSETLIMNLKERELLFGSEGQYSFGMSSPWPWSDGDMAVYSIDGNEAQIYYYAHTSDPHVAVWKEFLTFEIIDDKCIFTEEILMTYDYIASGEEYMQAYPNGINATPMDYLSTADGETLNSNALENPNSVWYEKLFEPKSAAITLLNLLDNPDKVEIGNTRENPDGSVLLKITFQLDNTEVLIKMIQPYGEDGIWIPHNE